MPPRYSRPPCPGPSRGAVVAVLIAAAAIPLGFALYTGLIWEDFLITFRYSENLARGLGLVYWPGERVQGFTSVLNTLLPSLFDRLVGPGRLLLVLWCYRLVCWAGLLTALFAVTRLIRRHGPSGAGAQGLALLFPLLAVLDVKTTAFTMSGQEAGLVLMFFAPAFVAACEGWSRRAIAGGFLFAGLMYCRPDGCVYIAALSAAALLFGPDPRKATLIGLFKSVAVGAGLYLPWFVFAWTYFGSPVPHTITAKYGVAGGPGGLVALVTGAIRQMPPNLCHALSPIYDRLADGPGAWPPWTHRVEFALELSAILYWGVPVADRIGRMASFMAFLLFAYLSYVNEVAQFSPWYYPPLTFMSLLALVCALAQVWNRLRPRAAGRLLAGAGAALALGLMGYTFFASLRPLRVLQDVVEWGNRRPIGLWLKASVVPGQTVYLEPLGYIGYFSGARMLDWPGLVSPEVVAARKRLAASGAGGWLATARALRPDWIVARIPDAEALGVARALPNDYALVRVFDVRREVAAAGMAPGMEIDLNDSAYAIFRRIR